MQEPGQVDTSSPWIVIPYFPGDTGLPKIDRPLNPLKGISYLCPSIEVKGVNYTAVPGNYKPDEPLSITVSVNNIGLPSCLVTVEVSWAEPSTGFAKTSPIDSIDIQVPGRAPEPTKSDKIIWTPESSKIPKHFCLLAKVATCTPPESETVKISPFPDPVGDKHWAQHNLISDPLPTSNKFVSVFWAVNPSREAAVFTVTVRPVAEEDLKLLTQVVKLEPIAIKGEQLGLHRTTEEASMGASRQDSLALLLQGGERQSLVVSADAPALASHQFTAMEVVQRQESEEHVGAITGSLGIVLFAAA